MKKLKLLKLPEQHRHRCLSLMYNMTKGIGPKVYDYQQRLFSDNTNHNLRSVSNHPNNIKLQPLSSIGNKRSFPCLAPSFWNDLPDNLKQIDKRKRFKNETKEYLLRNYSETCVCTNPLCTDRKFHWFFISPPNDKILPIAFPTMYMTLPVLCLLICFHRFFQTTAFESWK